MTDPSVLGACLDTGHWTFGTGGDPAAAARELRDRVWHVHFKDCDPAVVAESRAHEWDGLTSTGHGVFCELGKGSVDFPGVLRPSTRPGTTAGSSSSRTSCRAWATRARALAATAST